MKIAIILCLLIPLSHIYAQKLEFKNAVYAEIGGNAGYYSINYEQTFAKAILSKIGISVQSNGVTIPVLAGKYFGKSTHHFELLAGITYGYFRNKDITDQLKTDNELYATAFIGYRYEKPGKRFLFRAGYTPFYGRDFASWAGMSFGRRF